MFRVFLFSSIALINYGLCHNSKKEKIICPTTADPHCTLQCGKGLFRLELEHAFKCAPKIAIVVVRLVKCIWLQLLLGTLPIIDLLIFTDAERFFLLMGCFQLLEWVVIRAGIYIVSPSMFMTPSPEACSSCVEIPFAPWPCARPPEASFGKCLYLHLVKQNRAICPGRRLRRTNTYRLRDSR